MKIEKIRKDEATLTLHGNELWQLHHLLLAIINAEGDGKDTITRTAFDVDSRINAIVTLMGKVEEDMR